MSRHNISYKATNLPYLKKQAILDIIEYYLNNVPTYQELANKMEMDSPMTLYNVINGRTKNIHYRTYKKIRDFLDKKQRWWQRIFK